MKKTRSKKSQIWIETVIYTLIGLAIIGVLLAFLTPEIKERQDKIILEQSLNMIKNFENQIRDVVFYGAGNSRNIEFQTKKGTLMINSKNNSIKFFMDSNHQYSELNESVEIGKIKSLTKQKGEIFEVSFILNYTENITWNNKEQEKIFQPTPTPYKINIINKGKIGDSINIDFSSVN